MLTKIHHILLGLIIVAVFINGGGLIYTVQETIQGSIGYIYEITAVLVGQITLTIALAYICWYIYIYTMRPGVGYITSIILGWIWFLTLGDAIAMTGFQSKMPFVDMLGFLTLPNWDFLTDIYVWMGGGGVIALAVGIGYVSIYILRSHGISIKLILCSIVVSIYSLRCYIAMPDTRGSLQTQSIRNPILFSLGYGYEVLQNTWIDHAQTTDNDYANNFVSIPGEGKRKDIIYIFAESFSPIDSKKFGGKNNYFKQTDASVASGIYMPNLYAAGCVSEHAHISFLQGIFPIDYTLLMRKPDEYLPYKTYTDPLPLFMKRQGYDISFIGSAPLSFLHQGRYIESMGFSSGNIYGDDKFSQYKKYAFWSAPDKIMVKQLLDFYTQRKKSKKPIFMVGQTITSHLPYNNSPYGTRESDSRKYADDAIGDLIVGLQKKKFFKNGILIIVGDHRKMLKITQEEITRFGQSANAKVVGSIMGSGIDPDTVYSGIVQNPDIHYALKQMVATGNVWVWKDYNNPLTNVTNRNRGINVCRFQDKRIKVLYPDGKAERMPQVPSLLLKPIYTFIESFKNFQYQTVVKENVQTILSGALQPLSGVTIIGHAGTNKNTTRNSIEAFLLALRQGADGLEMDVSYTQDKKLVIYHGRTMSSTICGSGMNVDQLTFEYIRTHCPLKNGENIPTFDEGMKILQYIAPWMIVEIKVLDKNLGPAMLKDVLAVVNTYNLKHKAMIITYDETLRKELDILTGYRVGRDTYARSDVGIVDGDNYEFIMMPFDQITGYEQIKKYKREKKRFMTYTPQTDKDLISTFRRGAREFIVDDIPWARKVLQRELDS